MSNDPYQEDPRRSRRSQEPEEAESAGEETYPAQSAQFGGMGGRGSGGPGGLLGGLLRNPKLLLALGLAAFALIKFVLMPAEFNPVTDESPKIPWKPPQDVALGLEARDELIHQFGGELPDARLQREVDEIGMKLVKANTRGDWAPIFSQYKWDFHLLADSKTINAFALPGGQIFFTNGLYSQLKTESEKAGVMGHEIGHVIARHSAAQMAKNSFITQLVMAGAVAVSDGQQDSSRMAQAVAQMISMKYGRDHESQSDKLGVQFMINAGYDPEGLVGVMQVLNEAMKGNRQPEFLSTHPNPENRIGKIKQVIEDVKAGRIEGPKEVMEKATPNGVEAPDPQ